MTDERPDLLGRHQRLREELAGLLHNLRDVSSGLQLNAYDERLQTLVDRVDSDKFCIMMTGEFKRGKSTVINALLGQKVLPAYATPTTAIISEVSWGATASATLHPIEGEPVHIPVEELEAHVVIDEDDPEAENPYSHADIRWPLDVLEPGVAFVDCPGLNESPVREAVTLQFLSKADAVAFVIDAQAALSLSERAFLQTNIRPLGHEDVFFLCNKINLVEEDQRSRVESVTRKRLAELGIKDRHIFFVDARAALRARSSSDGQGLAESGIPTFETELERFLADERGKLKLLVPARDAKFVAREMRKALMDRRHLLDASLQELRERFASAQLPMKSLEADIDRMKVIVSNHIHETAQRVEDLVHTFVQSLVQRIPELANGYDPDNSIGLNPLSSKERGEALIKEITEYLTQQIKTEFATFQVEQLQPLVEERVVDLEAEIEQDLRGFLGELDSMRVELTSGVSTGIDYSERSAFERMVSAVGGVMLLDPGSAVTGARFGAKEMMKGLIVQLTAATAGVIIGLGPLGLAALLLATALGRGAFLVGRANRDLKKKIAEGVADDLRSNATVLARSSRNEVERVLGEVREAIDAGMRSEMETIRDHVELVIDEKESGELQAEEERRRLDRLDAEASSMEDKLDEFVANVAIASV